MRESYRTLRPLSHSWGVSAAPAERKCAGREARINSRAAVNFLVGADSPQLGRRSDQFEAELVAVIRGDVDGVDAWPFQAG